MNQDPTRGADGYRRAATGGPAIRADIVDVYIVRRAAPGPEFLQLLRAKSPLEQTWQPVMGHCETGESAQTCAIRELREEVGLSLTDPAMLGLWAMEQVHPFYLAALDCIVMSPRFLAEVDKAWSPVLNHEHSAHRWVPAGHVGRMFMWPGQRAAIREAMEEILGEGSLSQERLRLHPPAC